MATARAEAGATVELVADVLPGRGQGVARYVGTRSDGATLLLAELVSAFRTFYWGTQLSDELVWRAERPAF